MIKNWPAVRAVLALGPWPPLAMLLLAPTVINIIGMPAANTFAAFATLLGIAWLAIWILRNARRWVTMIRLAANGTAPELLLTAGSMVDTWPTLVEANGWVPQSALGQPPGLAQKILGFVTGNRTSAGPQIIRLEDAPSGPIVYVALTPRCDAARIAAASERIADLWGAPSVSVTRPSPAVAAIALRIRDPLAGTQAAFKSDRERQKPSVEDFLGGDLNA